MVCLGNICRSPAAQAVMQRLVDARGLTERFHIDSAGLGGWHVGDLPDKRMRVHARPRGYELTHRARKVQASDFEDFDLIVGMDAANVDDLHSRDTHLRVDVYRHSSSIILHGDRIILFDRDFYMFAISCQCLIDRVIHYFVYKMVESCRTCTAYVHTRSQTYRFKTLQYLYLISTVFLLLSHYLPKPFL